MFAKLCKIIDKIEEYPINISNFLLAFSAIMVIRLLGENLLSGFSGKSLDFFVGSSLAAWLFFLFSYLVMLIFLGTWLKNSLKKAANILLWGFWLAIFPPLLDKILCGEEACWSFYVFDGLGGLFKRFFLFFGDNPTVGITYGVRIEVALAVVFLTAYIFLKTKKAVKSLAGGLIAYAILFILGTFPSWLAFLFLAPEKKITSVENFDIAGLFLSPIRFFSFSGENPVNALNAKMNLVYAFLTAGLLIFFFWMNFRKKFWPVAKNVRWVQIAVHVGLIFSGAALGAFYFPANLTLDIFSFLAFSNLVLAAVFAWLASVFLNDRIDLETDKITNAGRPLATGALTEEEYHQLFWAGFAASLVLALTAGVKFFLVMLVYQGIGWIYSAWPYRLKRFPGIASFLSALALALLFSSGFMLLADGQDLSAFPPKVFWLLIVAFSISLPIKDLKDIEGDKKNGVFTIPVIFGESWARFLIGFGIFCSYALSVVWLNAKILFFPAMILGAISFWILQNKKISARRVHIWVFGFLFLYVVLMAYFLFWLTLPIVAMGK